MALMPEHFPRKPGLLASYDWFDFASGAGYKTFYLCGFEDGDYALTTNAIDGDYDELELVYTTAVGGASYDTAVDFDITFNVPVTIANADAIFNFTFTGNNVEIAGVAVSVKKNTTVIGTEEVVAESGAGSYRRAMKITLNKTSFAIGDILRVSIRLYRDNAGTTTCYIDPGTRTTKTELTTNATIGTDFTASIPFEVKE